MDNESTFGWGPEQIGRLLAVGADAGASEDERPPDRVTEDLLRDRLAGPLPLDKAVVDSLPVILGRLCRELLPLAGKPLGEVLLDPDTELSVLETVKDYGKGLPLGRKKGPEHAIAIAIYYAAIASALLYHDRKITEHSYENLEKSFAMLIDRRWLPPELSRHLAKAGKACKRKMK